MKTDSGFKHKIYSYLIFIMNWSVKSVCATVTFKGQTHFGLFLVSYFFERILTCFHFPSVHLLLNSLNLSIGVAKTMNEWNFINARALRWKVARLNTYHIRKNGHQRLNWDNLWLMILQLWQPGGKFCKCRLIYSVEMFIFHVPLTIYLSSYRIPDTLNFQQVSCKLKASDTKCL